MFCLETVWCLFIFFRLLSLVSVCRCLLDDCLSLGLICAFGYFLYVGLIVAGFLVNSVGFVI